MAELKKHLGVTDDEVDGSIITVEESDEGVVNELVARDEKRSDQFDEV